MKPLHKTVIAPLIADLALSGEVSCDVPVFLTTPENVRAVVLISAGTEWRVLQALLPAVEPRRSPYGAWFTTVVTVRDTAEPVVFLHGGWGKIAAAASTQYALDRWSPQLLVNLGTCGGFEGEIEAGTILLVERTLVYDIIEQMSDPVDALEHYATDLDLSWLDGELPQPVRRELLLSADRDLVIEEIPRLQADFGAVAADWESGAIAYVAARNGVRCLILRGVTDIVGPGGAEAYDGTLKLYRERTRQVLGQLLAALPTWLEKALPVPVESQKLKAEGRRSRV